MAENPRRARVAGTGRSAFDLAPDEAARWTARFGAWQHGRGDLTDMQRLLSLLSEV
jgi:hypothetical protein